MEEATFNEKKLLPLSVIEAARAGDPLAVNRVLRYYDHYINKLCTRVQYDKEGRSYLGVDEEMKQRLQSKLIQAIVNKP